MLSFNRILILLIVSTCVLTSIVKAQTPDSLLCEKALRLFTDAHRICESDGGELWGENLWGPVLLVRDSDMLTFTNEHILLPFYIRIDSLYCGILDTNIVVAGSAIRFKNMEVAQVPLYSWSDSVLIQVFIHELYHRFQNIHYDMGNVVYDNMHVDTKKGRTLVLCEMLELANALSTAKDPQSHIEKALEFRKWRWSLFPEKITDECRFEFQEGLALYTQYRLCLRDSQEVLKQLCLDVENQLQSTSLSRQYGYCLGAMYACLNDVDPSWRRHVAPSMNISAITSELYGIDFSKPEDTVALKQTNSYIRVTQIADSFEIARNLVYDKVALSLRTGSVIYVRTDNYQMGFNPACVLGLDELGNYFTVIELKGDFGNIYSEHGCLISNKPVLILPSKSMKRMNGESPGFSIKLNKGWRLKKSKDGYEIVCLKKRKDYEFRYR